MSLYWYKADVTRDVDGDTVHIDWDLGKDTHVMDTLRFMGINAPEMSTAEGKAAAAFVQNWLQERGGHIAINTVKDRREKYGRYLAYIYDLADLPTEPVVDQSKSLNQLLVVEGLAVPYNP